MSNNKTSEAFCFLISSEYSGVRLDKVLAALCEDYSRARLQGLIVGGHVLVNGAVCTSRSVKLSEGDEVALDVPEPVAAEPQAENIPLDVVYEDEDLLVINKPAGLVVHPGAGNWDGTLVNALLHHCGDSLSGIGGVLRPGIVHRLDKETSGLMVAAKSDRAHQGLAAQLEDRSLSRVYKALAFKVPTPLKGVVDAPLGRHPRQRQKMAVRQQGGKEARTHYLVEERYGEACALVECKLESGRTHQIRVHMEHLGHPLFGDPLYGPQPTGVRAALKKAGYGDDIIGEVLDFPRQALHAYQLSFIHPVSGVRREFESSYPEDFSKLLKLLS